MNESEVIALLIKELEGYLEYCKLFPGGEPSLEGLAFYLREKTSNG